MGGKEINGCIADSNLSDHDKSTVSDLYSFLNHLDDDKTKKQSVIKAPGGPA